MIEAATAIVSWLFLLMSALILIAMGAVVLALFYYLIAKMLGGVNK